MNGKKIFVTYGNRPYYKSLERIRKEAQDSGYFDKVMVFTDKDLPSEITGNILFSYKRGGGYWLWKPWVVLQALSEAGDDDIVVYSDCGNTIFRHKGWKRFFDFVSNHCAAFFYNGSLMKNWTRKSVFSHFPSGLSREHYQIISSIFEVRKSGENIIKEWYETMLNHPELVKDVDQSEKAGEDPCFIEHRHDQAVLSAVAYSSVKKYNINFMPEESERLVRGGQPVHNSRISDDNRRSSSTPVSTPVLFLLKAAIRPYRRFKTFMLNNFLAK